MKNRIITISRQFGSGGRTIGKKLAEKLNVPCYDAEIIEEITKKSGFAREYIEERSEDALGGNWFANSLGSGYNFNGHSIQDDLWNFQRKVVIELAEKESCVIVGRCADYILRDRCDCLRVFVYADKDVRAKRIVEQYGERTDSPQKRIRDKDKRRAAYYNFYTDMKWGAVQNYDVCLNSGVIGIEKCADVLSKLY